MIIRTPNELAHLVRDRRSELGLTQAVLAQRVGVSRKWIVDFETGKRTADLSLVMRTIKALGLEIEIRDAERSRGAAEVDLNAIVEQSKRSDR